MTELKPAFGRKWMCKVPCSSDLNAVTICFANPSLGSVGHLTSKQYYTISRIDIADLNWSFGYENQRYFHIYFY
jgi:hypothetical protein